MRHAIGQVIFVRLIRAWQAARMTGENPLPHIQASAALFDPAPGLAVACHSLLELIEAQLGRPLVTQRCCSREFSPDEAAMIGLLTHAQEAGPVVTSRTIPHGLPGAICWAAFAVMRELKETLGEDGARLAPLPELGQGCPFALAPEGERRGA